LPALYEEVLRVSSGMPVKSARLLRASALLERLRALPVWDTRLMGTMLDESEPDDVRLLAATLLAHGNAGRFALLAGMARSTSAFSTLLSTMACFTQTDTGPWYRALLQETLERMGTASAPDLPSPLLLLAFLKCAFDSTLTPTLFDGCVLRGLVLHPGVSAHRPLRTLHRLLDYLGLSGREEIRQQYRRLAASIWPQATTATWTQWQWVTTPGGPDLLPRVLEALAAGEVNIVRLYEMKYAPLPDMPTLHHLLGAYDPALTYLLCFLRPEVRSQMTCWPDLPEVLRWMYESNPHAARQAYAGLAWWHEWGRQGFPQARRALHMLATVEVPPSVETPLRHLWVEEYLAPEFGRVCANLLLAQTVQGESLERIVLLAEQQYVPAIRALGLMPAGHEEAIDLLRTLAHQGSRPVLAAAREALAYQARHRGLPGIHELERRKLLDAAWEAGPLEGERVRVGWQEGPYRFRVSLQSGKVSLDVLAPEGVTTRIPPEVRQSAGYRAAREAQRAVQAQYRLFKGHLERYMLESTPFTLGEFRYLMHNAVFAHLAERLLWRLADGRTVLWSGADCWQTLDGAHLALCEATQDPALTLMPVHPIQLSLEGTLVPWQECAADRRLMQPFKQLFREVYVRAVGAETHCRRFAGLQIDPRRGYAVLRAARFAPGNGVARREWRGGVTAHLCWAEGAAGRDLFGPHRKDAVPTGAIWFTRHGELMPLSDVDAIAYSETLRTADLLTARAAVGTASLTSRETVQLRITLLRQLARSFGMTNLAVPEDGGYALVLGELATYRVNLASGTVFLEPEGRHIAVPRHDARWRPVEEGDMTTEILATVLTLAHDTTIDDLTFLAQLPLPLPMAAED
jgi:hypothetical protein